MDNTVTNVGVAVYNSRGGKMNKAKVDGIRSIRGSVFVAMATMALVLVLMAGTASAGELTSVVNVPTYAGVGATTAHTIYFTTASEMPDGGDVVIEFPDGFGVSGIIPAESNMGGTFTRDTDGTTITLTRTGAAVPAGTRCWIRLSGLTNTQTAGGYAINVSTYNATGSLIDGPTTSSLFYIGAGPAEKYVIAEPSDGTVDAPITVTVTLQDGYGNTITTGSASSKDVTLTVTGDATGDGVVDIESGTGTLAISDQTIETVTLGLTDSQSTGYNVDSTQEVDFAVGAAAKVVFTVQPSATATAGADFAQQPTVTIQDQFGNTRTEDTNTITLAAYTGGCTTPASGTLNNTEDAVNGVAVFSGVSYTEAETIHIRASTGELAPACSDAVVVSNGVATQYVITDPGNGTVDDPITVTVTLQDQYGNNVTTGDDKDSDVTLTATGAATGAGVVVITDGTGTLTISDQTIETVTLGLTNPVALGCDISSTWDVDFAVGAADKVVFTVQPPATAGAGDTFTQQPIVTIQDQFGNTRTADTDTITLAAYTDECTTPASGTLNSNTEAAVNGVAVFSGVSYTEAETIHIQASTGGLATDCSDAVVVSHGVAAKYVITDPGNATVDDPITVTVTLQDQYGNTVTTGADKDKDVTLTATGYATGDGLVDIIDGTGTLAISDQTIETVTLGLTDSELTGYNVDSTQEVDFAVGAADKVVFTVQPSATAAAAVDFAQQPTVTVQDQFGNTRTADSGAIITLAAYIDAQCSVEATGTLSSNTKAVESGVAVFSGVSYTKAETIYLKASTGELATNCSDAVVVSGGAAAKYVITDPGNGTVDGPLNVTVTLQDAGGNIITTGADKDKDVTLNVTGNATGAGVVDITNGTGTLAISDQTIETVTLSLSNPVASGCDVSSTWDVDFAHGAATQYVITDPGDGTVDAPITVTVTLQDQYGNTITTGVDKDSDVTLNVTGSATGGVVDIVDGVGTRNVTDQVAETVTIGLTNPVASGCDVTSTWDVDFAYGTIAALNVAGITDPMVSTTTSGVSVTAGDQYGNTVTNYTGTIHFTSSDTGTGVLLPADYAFQSGDNGTKAFDGTSADQIVKLITLGTQTVTATDISVSSITGSQTVTVQSSAVTSYDINLVPGWNLVSTPLMPDNTSIEAVLDGMTNVMSVYAYDALNDWSYYIPGHGGDLVDITAENGYWIQMSGPETLTINGLFLGPGGATPPTYHVYAGWNLVGFHSLSADIPYNYLSNVRGDYASKMYGYENGAWVTVNNADVVTGTDNLKPGSGYWLYMRHNGTITP